MRAGVGSSTLVLWLAPLAVAGAQPKEPGAASTPRGEVVAFLGVAVVPADRARVIEDQAVIVRGGRIVEMGPTARVKVPAEARRIDGAGKFLMPGIAEMHGHLPGPSFPEEMVQRMLTLFVAAGVTTVRGMQGAPNQFALRARIDRGEVLGPRLFLYSPPLSGQDTPSPEEGIKQVRAYKAAGYDGLKILEDLTLPTYQAIARTAKELGMPFGGHVPNEVGLERALTAGQKSIDHLDGFLEALAPAAPPIVKGNRLRLPADLLKRMDEKRIPQLVSATRRAGAVVVPTMAVWQILFGEARAESLGELPELKYEPASNLWVEEKQEMEQKAPPAAQLRDWMDMRDRVLKAIATAGGMIVLGADAPQFFSLPGFSLRNETHAMRKAGMTPWQIIEAATVAPARYLGKEKEQGTVAVGQRADLLLLDGDPLEDPAHIFRSAGVMLNGRWLPRAELDRMLAEIEQTVRTLRYPRTSEVKDLPVASQEAARIAGSYPFPNGDIVSISLEKGGLMATAQGPQDTKRFRLQSQGTGTYLIPEIKAKITFEVGQSQAAALVFSQGGGQVKAPRRPASAPPPRTPK